MPPKIYNTKTPLDLNRLRLAKPINKNGVHFIKTFDVDEPIYFLGPKCFTKQGFVKSGKKIFCDFVFSNDDSDFLEWLENLEETSRRCIYENRETWFETPLDEHDIESSMASPYKPYKSGKYFIVRANVPTALDKINIKVYDENENETNPENIKENTKVLAVFEFQGIRCSVRSFQFEIELKQILIIEPEKIFEKCIISKTSSVNSVSSTSSYANNNVATLNEVTLNEVKINEVKINEVTGDILSSKDNVPIVTLPSQPDTQLVIDKHPENEPPLVNEMVDMNNMTNNTNNVNANDILTEEIHLDDLDKLDNSNDSNDSQPILPGIVENDLPNESLETISSITPIEITEVDFPLEDSNNSNIDIEQHPPFKLKNRNDVYYKLYKEMRQRAKEAKREALANYLEAKRIKNTYLLKDLSESESDEDDLEDMKL